MSMDDSLALRAPHPSRPASRIIVACEESGVIRRALRDLGHDAWSCDLQPARDSSPFHIRADAQIVAYSGRWDAMIFHWPCTWTANSGAKHLYLGGRKENGRDEVRWANMEASVDAFLRLWRAPIPRVCGEWPIIHSHARQRLKLTPSQIVQPWMFGHREMKATCLYLRGLRKLEPTDVVGPPPADATERKAWAVVHRMPPGPNRRRDRSATKPGIAAAMGLQWFGRAILEARAA